MRKGGIVIAAATIRPVVVRRDGQRSAVGGVRAETLPALLALNAGSAENANLLIDELWAGEPPDGAATTLRSYVSRLRSALGDDVSIARGGKLSLDEVVEAALDKP